MTQSIRLLVVHDDSLHRQCLAEALTNTGRYQIIYAVQDAPEALACARQELPHVVLVNWNLPGGEALELSRHMACEFPEVKVLLLGMTETAANVQACAEAGAAGYFLKEETFERLTARIEEVLRNETSCSARMASHLFSRLAELARERQRNVQDDHRALTFREQQILELIAAGLSNKQIAGQLCLSLNTVKNHIHHLLGKLAVDGRQAAANTAYQRQWLKKWAR
jgi:DNA-binding NarL/FixJ family response regulator